MYTVAGKVALITGAARGIGLAYAKELLRNNLKAVALIDIDNVEGQNALVALEKEFGKNRAILVIADVSNKQQFERAFDTTVKTFKQLDIVINNAGIGNEVDWERVVETNLVGTIIGSKLAMNKYLPQYKSGEHGLIVNMASLSGIHPVEYLPVYTATKHGIVGFSRSISSSLYESSKVKVVIVCPGMVSTRMTVVEDSQMNEPYLSQWREAQKALDILTPENLAEKTLEIIQTAESGSVWLILGEKITNVKFSNLQQDI